MIGKRCDQQMRESPFIHSAVKPGSQMLKLVRSLISFINIDAIL